MKAQCKVIKKSCPPRSLTKQKRICTFDRVQNHTLGMTKEVFCKYNQHLQWTNVSNEIEFESEITGLPTLGES